MKSNSEPKFYKSIYRVVVYSDVDPSTMKTSIGASIERNMDSSKYCLAQADWKATKEMTFKQMLSVSAGGKTAFDYFGLENPDRAPLSGVDDYDDGDW